MIKKAVLLFLIAFNFTQLQAIQITDAKVIETLNTLDNEIKNRNISKEILDEERRLYNKLKEDFENKIITQDDMTKEEVLALKNIYEKQIKELEKKDELLGKQV